MNIDHEKRYSAREAAQFLEVTEQTVQRYLREGELRGVRVGPKKKWYTLGKEIIALLQKWSAITPNDSLD